MNNQLERLLFIQGNRCFLCHQLLNETNASVEHLRAKANGGDGADENCIAICKKMNQWLGAMPLKDKLRSLLAHQGTLVCPDSLRQPSSLQPVNHEETKQTTNQEPDVASLGNKYHVLLKSRKNKPRLIKTLTKDITNHCSTDKQTASRVIAELQKRHIISLKNESIVYLLSANNNPSTITSKISSPFSYKTPNPKPTSSNNTNTPSIKAKDQC
jgi:hypothetical protein